MKNEMRLQGIGLVEGTEAGKIQVGDILRWNFGSLSRVVAIDFTKTGKTIIVTTEYFNEITGEMVQAERKMRVTRLVSIVASGNTKLISKYNYEMVEEVLAPEEAEALEAEVEEIIAEAEEAIKNHKKMVEAEEVVMEEKIKVTWFDYAKDKEFTEEITQNQLAFLEMQPHIDVDIINEQSLVEELKTVFEAYENKKRIEERQKEIEHVVNQIEEADDLKKSIHEISYRVTNHGSYVDIMLFVTDVANDVTLVAQTEGEYKNMEEAEVLISYLKKTGNKIEFVETMAYTG